MKNHPEKSWMSGRPIYRMMTNDAFPLYEKYVPKKREQEIYIDHNTYIYHYPKLIDRKKHFYKFFYSSKSTISI